MTIFFYPIRPYASDAFISNTAPFSFRLQIEQSPPLAIVLFFYCVRLDKWLDYIMFLQYFSHILLGFLLRVRDIQPLTGLSSLKHVFFSGLTSGVSKRIHCEILIYMYSDLSILKSSIHQYFNQVSLRLMYFCADITSSSNIKHCIMETRLWLKTTTSENQTEGR